VKIKVGIPRALSYYTFYPMWRSFIEKIGAEVLVSKLTNKKILETGIRDTVNDACVPIKVFQGHVMDLVGKVDYLFIPRMVSADGKVTFCPKFLGLPDMVRFSGQSLPPIIDTRYDRRLFHGGLFKFFRSVAKKLGVKNPYSFLMAMIYALKKQRKYLKLLTKGYRPSVAHDIVLENKSVKTKDLNRNIASGGFHPRIALLGYPYAIHDPLISAGIYSKLVNMGVNVITAEQIPLRIMRKYSKVLPQNFFWYYSNQVCWAGLYLLEEKAVDGIIHITAFGCGPDAMVDKTLELEARAAGMPFLSLAIDEHTGEGGVQTRLEAFVDMLTTKVERYRAV